MSFETTDSQEFRRLPGGLFHGDEIGIARACLYTVPNLATCPKRPRRLFIIIMRQLVCSLPDLICDKIVSFNASDSSQAPLILSINLFLLCCRQAPRFIVIVSRYFYSTHKSEITGTSLLTGAYPKQNR